MLRHSRLVKTHTLQYLTLCIDCARWDYDDAMNHDLLRKGSVIGTIHQVG
jgi:hypothetical protein